MSKKDVDEVARLHLENLPETASSKMGRSYLKRLYNVLITDFSINLALVAFDKGKIVGVITATSNLKKFKKSLLKSIFPNTIFLISFSLVSGRVSLKELIRRFYYEGQLADKLKYPHLLILTLYVDKKFRRQHVGIKLVNELKKRFSQKHYNIYVDTLSENKIAQKFYSSSGFEIMEKVQDSFLLKVK